MALLLTIFCHPLFTHAQETIGELKFSFFFDSLDGRLLGGQPCDPWPTQMCDIYLKICVKSLGGESCNIFDKQTQFWVNTHAGQTAVSFPLKHPIPETLEVIVEAWDHDPMNSPDLIARFRGQLVVTETPNTASKFKMERDDVRYSYWQETERTGISMSQVSSVFYHQHIDWFPLLCLWRCRLDTYVHIICARFHYGGNCSRKCIPDPERYACDISGFKKCRQVHGLGIRRYHLLNKEMEQIGRFLFEEASVCFLSCNVGEFLEEIYVTLRSRLSRTEYI
ncbi:hypothetical protein ACTXT7_007636 [Hymenolepis weldensis]